MFIGHFAVGFAAKGAAEKIRLGTLLAAAQLPDLLWPIFLLLGIEKVAIAPDITRVSPLDFVSYPISHSLVADAGWAALFAGLYLVKRKDSRGAFWIGACVLSHWVLDAASHRPDMPLYPSSRLRIGAGLWFSLPATVAVEGALFVAGLLIYLRRTRARDKVGVYAFWLFVGLLVVLYFGAVLGPPPPSVRVLAVSGLFGWLVLPWAYWIDRHRASRPPVLESGLDVTPGHDQM